MKQLFRTEKTTEVFAIDPKAFEIFFEAGGDREVIYQDGLAIVNICGPLEHHLSPEWDSYDAILCRIEEAFASDKSKAVVLKFDSPGGDAGGATEAHRKILALRAKYGKYLCAYVDEMMCSAAYELGSACDEIWLPDTATVGSIGVIATVMDATAANEAQGIKVELITTGERKGDGDPNKPLTDDVREALQKRVNHLGDIFFGLVAEARGLSVEKVRSFQAGVFSGQDAVNVGLATKVAGWDDFIRTLGSAVVKKSAKIGNRSSYNMKTLLQAIELRDAAKAQIVGAKSDKEREIALVAYEASQVEVAKFEAKAMKKTAKAEEDAMDDDCDEDAEDESAEEDAEDESAEEDAEEEAMDGDEDEDSDEDAVAAKGKTKSKVSAKVSARLLEVCQKITGKSDVREIMGSLEALGDRIKSSDQNAKDIASLKKAALREKVQAMLLKAKKDGKVTPAQMAHLRAQGVKDPKWLRGYLETLPKAVRNNEEAFSPDYGNESGPSLETQGLTQDQRKMIEIAAHHAGKSFDDQQAEINTRLKAKNGNGKLPRV